MGLLFTKYGWGATKAVRGNRAVQALNFSSRACKRTGHGGKEFPAILVDLTLGQPVGDFHESDFYFVINRF